MKEQFLGICYLHADVKIVKAESILELDQLIEGIINQVIKNYPHFDFMKGVERFRVEPIKHENSNG